MTAAAPPQTHDADVASARRMTLRRLLGEIPATRLSLAARRPEPTGAAGMRAERLDLLTDTGETVRAYLTGPPGAWRDRPAVLVIHAHGNRHHIGARELLDGRPALLDPPYGAALAGAGLLGLCLDLPCFGERATASESSEAKAHHWRGQTLFGRMLADLEGALALMRTLPEIAPKRISAFGLSMGATLAFWLAALDDRLAAVAHLCCFADLATLVQSGAHDLHGPYMTVPGLLPIMRTGEIAGLAAPVPQLVGVGLADPLTPPDAISLAIADLEAAYSDCVAADCLAILISPDTGHVETPAMRAEVLTFLSRHLAG